MTVYSYDTYFNSYTSSTSTTDGTSPFVVSDPKPYSAIDFSLNFISYVVYVPTLMEYRVFIIGIVSHQYK